MNKLILVGLLIALVASMHLKGHKADNATANASASSNDTKPVNASSNASAPAAESSSNDSKKAETPKANDSKAEAPKANDSKAEAPKADANASAASDNSSAADAKSSAPADNSTAPASDDNSTAADDNSTAPASDDNSTAADDNSTAADDNSTAADDNSTAADNATADKAASSDEEEKPTVKVFSEEFDVSLTKRLDIEKHNELRKKHGAPALVEDEELSKSAQEWADQLVLDGKLSHSKGAIKGQYGENLYRAIGSLNSALEPNREADERDYNIEYFEKWAATNKWSEEEDNYDWENNQDDKDGKVSGHFSAMVWKNVKRIGLGYGWQKVPREQGSDLLEQYSLYVVARYAPVPRVSGQFEKNVLPASE